MTVTQLEYLIAVVNHGSFSAAAQNCFVTQPSLSTQIGNLEDELGTVLLDRSQKPIAPTRIGHTVLEQARVAVSEFYRTKELMNELRGGLSGHLRVGVIPTISPYLMPGMVKEFTARCPDAELIVRDMFTHDLIDALSRDVIDIAILSGGQSEVRIRESHLFNDRLYMYVSRENELFGRKSVAVDDVDPHRLFILSEGNCLRNQTLKLCEARRKIKLPCDFVNCSLETLMNMVNATHYTTIIPGMAIGYLPEERRKQIVPFASAKAFRSITMAVGHSFVKESLAEVLRSSVMAAAGEFAISEFLVP